VVTLDIEDTCIRMMVVKGRRVETTATLPLEPGLVEDGVVVDKATVSQRIRELMAVHGVGEKQVVVSISGIHSIYRVARLPRIPKEMFAEAARREMERVMPVPLNELYTSWQALPVSDVEIAICLVGLPRNTIDAMLDTLREAGVESRVMDIRPLALARVTDEKDGLIINVQPASFDIVVVVDGIPELLRSLPFPSGDISVPDKVTAIKEELDRTVTFYNSGHEGHPITADTAAFVSGELGEILAEALGYPVKPPPELLSCPEGFDVSEYAANIGLALKQVGIGRSQVRVDINVVPEAYLPKPRPVVEIVSWVFVVVAIAVLVPLAVLTQREFRETLALQAQVDAVQLQVRVREGTEAEVVQLQNKVEKAKAATAVFEQPLEDFEAQRARVNGDLSKVTSLMPGTVDLESIDYGEEDLEISGTAPDEATILDYCRSLRDTARFCEVLVSDMCQVEYNEWDFTLTLDFATDM
jgi:type IV pilus assembly protein PilM